MNKFPIDVKKGALSCTLEQVWHLVLSRPLTCGQKYVRTVRFKIGVAQEQREDLESTINGSFGLKGISHLASSISAKSGLIVKFEKSKEIEETIEVEAPQNGRYLLRYYQKKQLFNFVGVESRWFSSEPWFLTVERGLDQYRDDSRRWKIDPACAGAGDFTIDPEPDGVIELVIGDGKITLSTPYRITDTGIVLTDLGLNTEADLTQLLNSRTSLPRGLLPHYIQVLGKDDERNIDAIILPYQPLMSSGNSYVQRPDLHQQTFIQPNYTGAFQTSLYPDHLGSFLGSTRDSAFPYAIPKMAPMITPIIAPELKIEWEDKNTLPFTSFEEIAKIK